MLKATSISDLRFEFTLQKRGYMCGLETQMHLPSGLPPTCLLVNPHRDPKERLSKPNSRLAPNSDVEVGASAPAVLSRRVSTASAKYPGQPGTATGLSRRQSRLDVVFAVSTGVVSCYDDEGRLKWQDRHGPKWWFPPGGMAAKEGKAIHTHTHTHTRLIRGFRNKYH